MKKDADFISEEEFFVIKDYEEKARNWTVEYASNEEVENTFKKLLK